MAKSSTIIFFGTEDFSLTSLQALVANGFKVAAVVTKSDQPRGRGQKIQAPAVKEFALKNNIEVWQPAKISDLTEQIKQLQPVAGVLVSYGKIIPQAIIDLFSPGIINLHPSLLPKYRGPTPIESAIINGDSKTGVSVMQLEAAMDAGPVYAQKELSLNQQETQPELYRTLGKIGADFLVAKLPAILGGDLKPVSQDESLASYCSLLLKRDAWLDCKNLSAPEAERKIRAHLSYPRTKYTIADQTITITQASAAEETTDTPLALNCQQGVLAIEELVAPSGKIMSAADFKRGYLK